MKESTLKLKKWVRTILILIMLLLFILFIFLIFNSFNVMHKKSTIIYTYNTEPDLSYKVYLFKNTYIEDEYLNEDYGKKTGYLSDLVNTVNAKFDYNYQASDITNLNYKYKVTGIIKGEYRIGDETNTSDVWTKEYPILKEVSGQSLDASQLFISKDVEVDYHFFDNEVAEFRKNLKMAIVSNLTVRFDIEITGEINGKEIKNNEHIDLIVPLNQQAFKVEKNIPEPLKKNITLNENDEITQTVNYTKLTIGIMGTVIVLVTFISSFKVLFDYKEKSNFEINRNKYLKEYGDIIVEVVTPVYIGDLRLISVKNFNELVDLEEELRIPIVFYEDVGKHWGQFSIIHDDTMYEYILNDETEK